MKEERNADSLAQVQGLSARLDEKRDVESLRHIGDLVGHLSTHHAQEALSTS